MAVFLFKITLLRSNPQIIREFFIKDTLTVEDLLETIWEVHNWERPEKLRLNIWPAMSADASEIPTVTMSPDASEIPTVTTLPDSSGIPTVTASPDASEISDFSVLLKDFISGGTRTWLLEIPMVKPNVIYWYRERKEEEKSPQFWRFRIELMDVMSLTDLEQYGVSLDLIGVKASLTKAGNQGLGPDEIEAQAEAHFQAFLWRAIYYHPWQKAGSMKYSNRMLKHLDREERMVAFDGSVLRAVDLMVDMDHINRKLMFTDSVGGKGIRIRHDLGISLLQMLEYSNLDSLKRMIRYQRLGMSYNKKKSLLLEELVHYMDREDFWEEILVKMEYQEYCIFRQIVQDQVEIDCVSYRSFPVLENYLIVQAKFDFLRFPKELLAYYEQRLYSQGDEDLMADKRMRTCLSLAAEIYGIVRKEVCRMLYRTMWESDYSEADFERRWLAEYEKTQDRWAFKTAYSALDEHSIYRKVDYDTDRIDKLWKKVSLYPSSAYYKPTQDELQNIMRSGLNFSPDMYKKLKQFLEPLQRWLYYYDSRSNIIKAIYRFCQKLKPLDSIEHKLEWEYHLRLSVQNKTELRELIKLARLDVRRFDLLGYTEYEWKEMNEQHDEKYE